MTRDKTSDHEKRRYHSQEMQPGLQELGHTTQRSYASQHRMSSTLRAPYATEPSSQYRYPNAHQARHLYVSSSHSSPSSLPMIDSHPSQELDYDSATSDEDLDGTCHHDVHYTKRKAYTNNAHEAVTRQLVSRQEYPYGRSTTQGKQTKPGSTKFKILESSGQMFQNDREFAIGLHEMFGWEIVPMKGDGACLFRAISYHVLGDAEYHLDVRQQCIEYMEKNRDDFQDFVPGDFDEYLEHKAKSTTYGNHLEIQALSELYNRTIEVYSYSTEPINIFHSARARDHPIRLSYHNNIHYNAIVDPQRHMFGIGLGLPGIEQSQPLEEKVVKQMKERSLEDAEVELLATAATNSMVDLQRNFSSSPSSSSRNAEKGCLEKTQHQTRVEYDDAQHKTFQATELHTEEDVLLQLALAKSLKEA